MTTHLGLDDLTYLADSDGPSSAADHLSGCDLCGSRLANLRARSAEVSAALAGIDGTGGGSSGFPTEVGPMPAEVAARITAALAGERDAQPNAATRTDEGVRADESRTDDSRADELARARHRRRQRLRGWLVAAAVVVVVGTGFGAVQHFAVGTANNTSAGSAAAGDESLPAPAAGRTAAKGQLSTGSFAADARAFVAAHERTRSNPSATAPAPAPLTVPRPTSAPAPVGSARCATTAASQAAAIAGARAAGGNTVDASAQMVGTVTVDGRDGVLYLVDVGPVKVAVALAGCSTSSPNVLAGATL